LFENGHGIYVLYDGIEASTEIFAEKVEFVNAEVSSGFNN